MKLKFLTAFLLCILCANTHAQSTADEIENLIGTTAVTYSQAVRFALEASDTAKISDPLEAFNYAREHDLLPKNAKPDMTASLEGVSLVMMKAFGLKGGLFYSMTKNPHYAYRELIYKNVIQSSADPGMNVSGSQLLYMTGRLLGIREKEAELAALEN